MKTTIEQIRILTEELRAEKWQQEKNGAAKVINISLDNLEAELKNLAKFCRKIVKQEDCPPEFIEIVNKEFWSLI